MSFGPNARWASDSSHRSREAQALYAETQALFKNKFDLKDYEIAFIPRPPTVGMEAILTSCTRSLTVMGAGRVADRWRRHEGRISQDVFKVICC